MLNDGVIITIIGASLALIIAFFRYIFASKCDSVSICWGCIKSHRNTQDEMKDINIEVKNTPV